MNNFYVYIHRRLSDNTPFYVGKGSGNRAWTTSGRNPYWLAVKEKYGFKVEIVFDALTEEEAFACEVDTIKEMTYFGYPLTNLTSGGEGQTGLRFTDKQRLNIANGLKEKRFGNKERNIPSVKRPKAFGANNHFADTKEYTFIRLIDGLEVTCTRHALAENYGADKQLLKKLFYNKPRKSASGWKLKG
jgi:hypothetical protein